MWAVFYSPTFGEFYLVDEKVYKNREAAEQVVAMYKDALTRDPYASHTETYVVRSLVVVEG